jgi:hypothetical protein
MQQTNPHSYPNLPTGLLTSKVTEFDFMLCSEVKEGDAHREVELDDDRAAGQEGSNEPDNDAQDATDEAENERDQRANANTRNVLVSGS